MRVHRIAHPLREQPEHDAGERNAEHVRSTDVWYGTVQRAVRQWHALHQSADAIRPRRWSGADRERKLHLPGRSAEHAVRDDTAVPMVVPRHELRPDHVQHVERGGLHARLTLLLQTQHPLRGCHSLAATQKLMKIVKPPQLLITEGISVFLAGSIEMGVAEEWQDRISKDLADLPGTILNPRRDNWDSSWVQEITNRQFRDQVVWELDGLELADIVVFYFDPATKSPITLMELGLQCNAGKRVIVCCPSGFWRKGNVDILCDRYDFTQVSSLEELTRALRKYIRD